MKYESYTTNDEEEQSLLQKTQPVAKKWPRAALLLAGLALASFGFAVGTVIGHKSAASKSTTLCASDKAAAVAYVNPCTGANPPARCMSAQDVALLTFGVQNQDQNNFCISAVAVAFGESSAFEDQNGPNYACPTSTPRCLDSQAVNQWNPDVKGLWQMMRGGDGTPAQQAQSMYNEYASSAFCAQAPGAPGFWPAPELLVTLDQLPAESNTKLPSGLPYWRFCKGAWTGDNLGNQVPAGKGPNYYAQFQVAATQACGVAAADWVKGQVRAGVDAIKEN
jgi:hypothetical protein